MPTKYKLTVWHVLIVLLALVFWTYTAGVISHSSDSFDLDPEGIIYLLMFASVIALGFALFQKKWLILSFSAAIGVPYLLALPGYWAGAGIAFMLLFLLYSWSATVRELKERSKVNIGEVLKRSLGGVILAIFIAVSFAAYESPLAAELEKTQRLPSSTERFIAGVVRGTIGTRLEGSEQEKQTIVAEVSRQTFQELNNFIKPYFRFAPPLLAFGLFLVLWGLSWFFIQLSVLLGILIFWILKKTKMVMIEEKDVKAEVLSV